MLRPIVRFNYFPRTAYMRFSNFGDTDERIEKAVRSYELAEDSGWDRVGQAIRYHGVLPGPVLRRPAGLRRRPARRGLRWPSTSGWRTGSASWSGGREGFSERKMFGGIAFMLHGNMCCGVMDEDLIVRLGRRGRRRLPWRSPHVRPFDFTGRPMKSTVLVDSPAPPTSGSWPAGSTRARTSPASLPPK